MFPTGTHEDGFLWGECCLIHDASYWMGGSKQDRKLSDRALRDCVSNKGQDIVAWIMYMGVSVGGSADFKTDWRWGYGWSQRENYKELNLMEKKHVLEIFKSTKNIPLKIKKMVIEQRLEGVSLD